MMLLDIKDEVCDATAAEEQSTVGYTITNERHIRH